MLRSRGPALLLFECGASLIVSSIKAPERSVMPLSTRCAFTSAKRASVSPCRVCFSSLHHEGHERRGVSTSQDSLQDCLNLSGQVESNWIFRRSLRYLQSSES